jgi:hypothetical protein
VSFDCLRRVLSQLLLEGRGRGVGKVDFLIAGAQKAGTSALFSYLGEHPEICLSLKKEVHYFDHGRITRLPHSDRYYHSWFPEDPGDRLVGEATPIYLYWKSAPRRIQRYNPGMKVVVLLRNPITRAYSHWNMERQRGTEPLEFLEAIRTEAERCRAVHPLQHRHYSYVDRGRYAGQLRRLRDCFPEEQILCLQHEELLQEPQNFLDQVTRFLGVSDLPCTPRTVHAVPYDEPLPREAHELLVELLGPEIEALEELLGWDCSHWFDHD